MGTVLVGREHGNQREEQGCVTHCAPSTQSHAVKRSGCRQGLGQLPREFCSTGASEWFLCSRARWWRGLAQLGRGQEEETFQQTRSPFPLIPWEYVSSPEPLKTHIWRKEGPRID